MLVFSLLRTFTLESFASRSRVVANNAACVAGMPAPRAGLLPARKNRSLASRTSGRGPDRCLSNPPVFKRKKKGEERWSAACRAHVRHSRVAHAASISFEREICESHCLIYVRVAPRLTALTQLRLLSGSNWFDGTCTQHLYGDACINRRPLFSNPLPSSTLPAFLFQGAKEMSPPAANSLSSEFY